MAIFPTSELLVVSAIFPFMHTTMANSREGQVTNVAILEDYRIVGRPWSLHTYVVHYNNSLTAIFGAPSSSPGEGRHMRLVIF